MGDENYIAWSDRMRAEGREEGIEQGIEQGREQGREDGSAERAIDIANRMLADGMTAEDIRKYTGVDVDTL